MSRIEGGRLHVVDEKNSMLITANKGKCDEVRIGLCKTWCTECCMDDCVEKYRAHSGTCEEGPLGPYTECICHYC